MKDSDPWETVSRWGEPYNYPSLLPWEFPGCIEIKGIQTELKGFPEVSRWNWESDVAKEARVHRAECQREERAAGEESFGEVQIVYRKHSPEHWLAYACEETLKPGVENIWKYYEGKVIRAYKEG